MTVFLASLPGDPPVLARSAGALGDVACRLRSRPAPTAEGWTGPAAIAHDGASWLAHRAALQMAAGLDRLAGETRTYGGRLERAQHDIDELQRRHAETHHAQAATLAKAAGLGLVAQGTAFLPIPGAKAEVAKAAATLSAELTGQAGARRAIEAEYEAVLARHRGERAAYVGAIGAVPVVDVAELIGANAVRKALKDGFKVAKKARAVQELERIRATLGPLTRVAGAPWLLEEALTDARWLAGLEKVHGAPIGAGLRGVARATPVLDLAFAGHDLLAGDSERPELDTATRVMGGVGVVGAGIGITAVAGVALAPAIVTGGVVAGAAYGIWSIGKEIYIHREAIGRFARAGWQGARTYGGRAVDAARAGGGTLLRAAEEEGRALARGAQERGREALNAARDQGERALGVAVHGGRDMLEHAEHTGRLMVDTAKDVTAGARELLRQPPLPALPELPSVSLPAMPSVPQWLRSPGSVLLPPSPAPACR